MQKTLLAHSYPHSHVVIPIVNSYQPCILIHFEEASLATAQVQVWHQRCHINNAFHINHPTKWPVVAPPCKPVILEWQELAALLILPNRVEVAHEASGAPFTQVFVLEQSQGLGHPHNPPGKAVPTNVIITIPARTPTSSSTWQNLL